MPTKKIRVDQAMVEKQLAETRSMAQRLIMEGKVRVNGQQVLKPSQGLLENDLLELEQPARFVSRGGEKLAGAFEAFHLEVSDLSCADVGSSTGGFTDCLLQHGAKQVYAIDVGYGLLHWKLRSDPRVIVMERTNARFVEKLPEPVEFVTIDASFISLDRLLSVIRAWYPGSGGRMLALIKPQFEAGKQEVDRGEGVIRDPQIHRRILTAVLEMAFANGYGILGLAVSPLKGPKGNVEFLAYLEYPQTAVTNIQILVDAVLEPEDS